MSTIDQNQVMKFCPVCQAKVLVSAVYVDRVLYIENGDSITYRENYFRCEHAHFFVSALQLEHNLTRYADACAKILNT